MIKVKQVRVAPQLCDGWRHNAEFPLEGGAQMQTAKELDSWGATGPIGGEATLHPLKQHGYDTIAMATF